MKQDSIQHITVVDGVVLTDEAIKELKSWQDNNNEGVDLNSETVSDAVCFIGSILYMLEDDNLEKERRQATFVISALASLREDLKKFTKP